MKASHPEGWVRRSPEECRCRQRPRWRRTASNPAEPVERDPQAERARRAPSSPTSGHGVVAGRAVLVLGGGRGQARRLRSVAAACGVLVNTALGGGPCWRPCADASARPDGSGDETAPVAVVPDGPPRVRERWRAVGSNEHGAGGGRSGRLSSPSLAWAPSCASRTGERAGRPVQHLRQDRPQEDRPMSSTRPSPFRDRRSVARLAVAPGPSRCPRAEPMR